ncbi:unnamed protein product [Haemonchus placei]|uniref:EF-hand domain-containing protein n=1 Tax=Haemonchus placei TaxID=6290 RepID=A0A0N4VZ74_HAEPC|nr:unnamed protein product [Haemonchus placei]
MFDSNGDGAINFNEFQALWQYINDWTNCFRGFDLDNSGNIDKSELQNALTRFGYRLSDQFYNILMMKFDRTHTGHVNFDDFIQLCVVLQTLTAAFRSVKERLYPAAKGYSLEEHHPRASINIYLSKKNAKLTNLQYPLNICFCLFEL